MSKPKPYTLSFEIKPLSEADYSAAPEAVRKVYISVLENIPLSSETIKATIKAHPEYFTLKEKKVKKSFGENFKRLSNLKMHKESFQKKITIAKKVDVEFPHVPGVSFEGTHPGFTKEQIAWVKSLPNDEHGLPPLPEGQKEFLNNLKKY